MQDRRPKQDGSFLIRMLLLRYKEQCAISFSSLKEGGKESGFVPLGVIRTGRKESREIQHAEQLERDLLDFSVRPSLPNCSKEIQQILTHQNAQKM